MYSKIPKGYWIGGFLTRCIRIMPILLPPVKEAIE